MPLIHVTCNRCKNEVTGFESIVGTAGFYRTSSDYKWSKYADPNEHIVCDECMYKDERYLKDHRLQEVGEGC